MSLRNVLTVLILTKDEEANLPHTLVSLRDLDPRIVVVDSGSSDRTVEVARRAGAEVIHHPFTSQADQVNWSIESLPFDTEWIMRLDADERVTPELAAELRTILPAASSSTTAFEVKRRVYFWGRWIRYGGYYPTWLLRIWRVGAARSEQRSMDEHMISLRGTTGRLKHDIIDENHKGLSFWVEKHNQYSSREVSEMLRDSGVVDRVTGQAARRRWLKVNVYRRAPPFARAVAYWAYRYFLLLGFLDGLPGLVFHFNQGLWYRLLVDAKLREARHVP